MKRNLIALISLTGLLISCMGGSGGGGGGPTGPGPSDPKTAADAKLKVAELLSNVDTLRQALEATTGPAVTKPEPTSVTVFSTTAAPNPKAVEIANQLKNCTNKERSRFIINDAKDDYYRLYTKISGGPCLVEYLDSTTWISQKVNQDGSEYISRSMRFSYMSDDWNKYSDIRRANATLTLSQKEESSGGKKVPVIVETSLNMTIGSVSLGSVNIELQRTASGDDTTAIVYHYTMKLIFKDFTATVGFNAAHGKGTPSLTDFTFNGQPISAEEAASLGLTNQLFLPIPF